MTDRVRTVLITPANQMLAIRRQRPNTAVYRVLPGGHVEPADTSLETALLREIREELAGAATIHSLLRVLDEPSGCRQYIYLARIDTWSFPDRTGSEFTDPGNGTYTLDAVPFTAEQLAVLNLKPDRIAQFLIEELRNSIDVFDLPDLRPPPPGVPGVG